MARHQPAPADLGPPCGASDLRARHRAARFICHKVALPQAPPPPPQEGESGSQGSPGCSHPLFDWLGLGVSVTRADLQPVSVSRDQAWGSESGVVLASGAVQEVEEGGWGGAPCPFQARELEAERAPRAVETGAGGPCLPSWLPAGSSVRLKPQSPRAFVQSWPRRLHAPRAQPGQLLRPKEPWTLAVPGPGPCG